jgi:hypothetical protein
MLTVSVSYKNYQNCSVSNQLTDSGRRESVLGVTIYLLMYFTIVKYCLYVNMHPKEKRSFKYDLTYISVLYSLTSR